MYDYIFFDLDGTLTDPSLGITNSIMYALRKMGREVPERESLYRFIGPPLVPAFRSFLGMTEEEAQDALRLYREYFADRGIFENTPYDGIAEVLGRLCSNGKKLCVATSKPELFAGRILEHFGMAQYFTLVCGASMDEKRVEKADIISYAIERLGIEKDGVIMVGDRHHDIEGAAKCGIPSVGVLWGFGSREELIGAGALHIVSSPDDLYNLFGII